MICIHPTVAASPKALAALQLETGLRAMPGQIFGRLVDPLEKPRKPRFVFSIQPKLTDSELSKMLSQAVAELTNEWDGGSAA